MSGPYAQAARMYREAGWLGVLPADLGGNGSVPSGFTGHEGAWPDDAQVSTWVTTHADRNVGLRVPEDVIVIDVDGYDGKPGCETLDWYERNAGELPPTWSSTSRGPHDCSRKLFYRVPAGTRLRSNLPGVDLLQRHHRWARVWPSINPRTGQPERWYGPDRTVSLRLPAPSELTALPEDWRAALAVGSTNGRGSGSAGGTGGRGSRDVEVYDGEGRRVDPHRLLVEGVPPGSQDDELFRYLSSLRARGAHRDEMIVLALAALQLMENDPTAGKGDWTSDQIIKKVDEVRERYEPGPSLPPLTDAQLAFVRGVAGGEDIALEKAVRDRLGWHRADRVARRVLDEEELATARGPRVRRTAREYASVDPPAVVMDDVLIAEVNLLAGPPGAGKSLLARDWALAVAAGGEWRGHRVPEPRGVLWVASEGLHDFAQRWTGQPGWERAADRVLVLDEPVNLLSPGDVRWLLDEYKQDRPGLVVFDVIYGMGMTNDNDVKSVVPLLAALKRISAAWGAATLALGHPGHNGERRFRGSSMWRDLAGVEWHLADGRLSCEKSKIADTTRLGAACRAEYPYLRWPSAGESLGAASDRVAVIGADLDAYPGDNISERARRLAPVLDLSIDSTRRAIRGVVRSREGAE